MNTTANQLKEQPVPHRRTVQSVEQPALDIRTVEVRRRTRRAHVIVVGFAINSDKTSEH